MKFLFQCAGSAVRCTGMSLALATTRCLLPGPFKIYRALLYTKTAFRVAPHAGVWSKRSLKFCVLNHVSVMLLSTNRRASRLFAFYERFLPILHGYVYTKVVRVPFAKKLGKNVEELWLAQHEWGADKLAHMLQDLSGFYLKVAQVFAAKQDMLPRQYTERIAFVFEECEPMDRSTVDLIVRNCLNHDVYKALEINDQPIACATIAQVHRVAMKGSDVPYVIKIQRDDSLRLMELDMSNMLLVSKVLDRFGLELPFDHISVLLEYQKQIPREFDFHRERAMMEFIGSSIHRNFKDVYVPTVLPGASSSKIITMTYMQGVSLAKFIQDRKGIQRTSLSTFAYNLVAVFGYQIFEIGTFHSDPHPGNILLQENGSFTLLDFGQVKVLSDNVRIGMAQLVVALSNDSSYVSDCFKHLGLKVEGATESLIETVAYVIFDTRMDIPEANMNPFDDSIPHEMRAIKISTIPQEVFMLIRIIALLRGILSSIGIDIHSRNIWLPYARSFLNQRKIRILAEKPSSEKVGREQLTQKHAGMEQIAKWMAQQDVRSDKERLKHLALANIWSMEDFAEFLSTGTDDQIQRVLRGFSLDERAAMRQKIFKWPAT